MNETLACSSCQRGAPCAENERILLARAERAEAEVERLRRLLSEAQMFVVSYGNILIEMNDEDDVVLLGQALEFEKKLRAALEGKP